MVAANRGWVMRRRQVLASGVATVATTSQGVWSRTLAATPRSADRVRPSDAGWPDAAAWQRLKDQVGGSLHPGTALFSGCDPSRPATCTEVETGIRNPFYIGDQNGGTQVSGWLDAWAPAPSAFVVAAQKTSDVVAAVNFARVHNLRLVVKGAGHSYQGTSNAPDSLLIWTRAMKAVTLHDQFVPKGSDAAPVPAVSAQSGAVWIDLYDAVTTKAGRYVQGGGCADVGVAGLIQSGGFGVHSKGCGTAASSLLEAEIVTADGRVRIVNAHNDPDLLWAIKGGGGGSFGVVTRVTLKTDPLPAFFGGAFGKINATSDKAFHDLIKRFLNFYGEVLFNPGWGEQVRFGPGNQIEINMQSHDLTADQIKAVWQPFFDWVHASPMDYEIASPLSTYARPARTAWVVDGNQSMERDLRPGAPAHRGWFKGDQGEVGAYLHGYDSMWLPSDLLIKPGVLVDALFAASRFKMVRLFFNKGLSGANREVVKRVLDTAMNPDVINSFALAIIADGEGAAYPGQPKGAVDVPMAKADATAIERAAAALRTAAPDAGSYVSESNYFNANWQAAFWGRNYPRLRAVKRIYDPTGLFVVHHGVGSEDWSPDGFRRV
jgi:FAD/FMN-containing dehydrogenase